MKKVLLLMTIGTLIISGFGASALNVNNEKIISNEGPRDYTHTVLIEVGTRTTCSACPASNTAWHTIYEGGNYDFEYTELVYNMNSVAYARFLEFNPAYVPTSYFDGGEYIRVGTSYSAFYSYLDASGSRVVPDLVADLDVTWLGCAEIEISYSVLNNDANDYGGRIRIYVIELVSTLWNDYSGNPYYHAFLDFAENKAINIAAGGSISDTITWDGAAAGYPSITIDNIQIILAVFSDTPHQSYSDPPTGLPNDPPEDPEIAGPNSGNAGTSYPYTFTSTDPDGDDVSYYIKWGDGDTTSWTTLQASGTPYAESHTWDDQGTFTIEAKAKDEHCAESGWSTFEVTMPRSRTINTLFLRFLQNHPNAFLILRQLLGL